MIDLRGRKHSPETKAKIRASRLGKPHPHRGYVISAEARANMSAAQKGKPSPHKGKKGWFTHSQEARAKMRTARKGYIISGDTRAKISHSLMGHPGHAPRGEKSNLWRGGVALKNRGLQNTIRATLEYRQWRSDVFHRDNFICQECGIHGGSLEAHHIKSFQFILSEYKITCVDDALGCAELWDINNGKTLCTKCHNETKKGGTDDRFEISP